MQKKQIKISVIIPFYCVHKGILINSVRSVLNQDFVGKIDLIIIDDGSPIDAQSELREVAVKSTNISMRIIKQRNRGLPAARNLGLENVDSNTDYISFLDSDDIWPSNFLSEAFRANVDFDLFFADVRREDSELSVFEINLKAIPDIFSRNFEIEKNIFKYEGDLLFDFSRSHIVIIVAIIYKYKKFNHLRFNESLINVEDTPFLFLLISQARSFIYSTELCIFLGVSENIAYGIESYQHPRLLRKMFYRLKAKYLIMEYAQQIQATECLSIYRTSVQKDIILTYDSFFHFLLRPSQMQLFWIWEIVKLKPGILMYFPYFFLRAVFRKFKSHLSRDKSITSVDFQQN